MCVCEWSLGVGGRGSWSVLLSLMFSHLIKQPSQCKDVFVFSFVFVFFFFSINDQFPIQHRSSQTIFKPFSPFFPSTLQNMGTFRLMSERSASALNIESQNHPNRIPIMSFH